MMSSNFELVWGMISTIIIFIILITSIVVMITQFSSRIAQSKKMFKSLFDRTHDMLVVINPKGEIMITNIAFQDELGYSGKNLLKRPISDIIYKNDRRRFKSAIKALFDKRDEFHGHISLINNEGGLINIEAICYTIQNPNLQAILNFHVVSQVDESQK